MFESEKLTRIGDILVDRGIITRTQLLQALDLQQARLLLLEAASVKGSHNELGEILIELGFITRDQLKKNLARQNRLRKTTLAITLVAPLFTMACGGGGGGSSNTPVNKPGQNAVSSSVVVNQSSSAVSSTPPQSPESSSSSSSVSSSSSSSAPVVVDGPVVLYWAAPTRRENGNHLDLNELGGYEIRYRVHGTSEYTYLTIKDGYTDTYYFDYLKGEYEFQIAAYDVTGIFSRFVTISPAN